MSKLKFSALLGAAAILLGAMTGPLMAGGLGIGIQGAIVGVETTGSETLKSNSTVSTAEEGAIGAVPSGFVQWTFGDDGFVIGVEKIPGSLQLGHKERVGPDLTSANDPNERTTDTVKVTNIAKANIQEHYGVYLETPSLGGVFLKVGYQEATINTDENLQTGASYDDETVTGYSYGLGFRGVSENGLLLKLQAEYIDFDDVSFQSKGSDAVTTIKAEPEAYALKISLGYNF